MSLRRWMASVLQPPRPTSCHLHLLNEIQPVQPLQPLNTVGLAEPRPVGESSLDLLFLESVSDLGGKGNILLVGEAGYSPENGDGIRGILGELSFALFGTPMKDPEAGGRPSDGSRCISSGSASRSRALGYPVILAVFRDTLLTDTASNTLVREVLRDVRERTTEAGSAVVGIVLTRERRKEDLDSGAEDKLAHLMGQVFKRQPWGVCCYHSQRPKSIQAVKWTILKTLGERRKGGDAGPEYQNYNLVGSFRDLVCRLGGKERFLLLGNICPSTSPSGKVGVFKELTQALFDDAEDPLAGRPPALGSGRVSNECVQLPAPRSFTYPLILVAFRSGFLKEVSNRGQVKEILVDIKTRVEMSSTQVVGVLCSQEPLGEPEQMELHNVLQKVLGQVFHRSAEVCSFVRSRPETADQVKRCVCRILKKAA